MSYAPAFVCLGSNCGVSFNFPPIVGHHPLLHLNLTFSIRRRQVYMIEDLMERGPLLKEGYDVEPIPENLAITKFIQVRPGRPKKLQAPGMSAPKGGSARDV